MIIIPSHILNSGMSPEDMIKEGYRYTELLNKGLAIGDVQHKNTTIFHEPIIDNKKNDTENWSDPSVGILVGPNNNKSHRLSGAYFKLFIALYKSYGNKNGKRNAAWAFFKVIVPLLNKFTTIEEKEIFGNKILKAAMRASIENEELRLKGSTPQFLQGWISNMKWEDYD